MKKNKKIFSNGQLGCPLRYYTLHTNQEKEGDMYGAIERRQLILNVLCERRSETIDNLAFEFSVHRNTIKKDIEVLSFYFPLFTTKGTGGGVHIVEGYRLGMKYLTDRQCEVLEILSKRLSGEEKLVILEILKTFKKPQGGKIARKTNT